MPCRVLGLIAILLAACSSEKAGPMPTGTVGLNDVAVLFPLPSVGEEDLLLRPTDEGGKGRLLPDFSIPGPALVMLEERATTIERLRLVAVRLDPCFPNMAVTDLRECRQVIHLIWQPVVDPPRPTSVAALDAGTGPVRLSTADAAVHSFHFLPAKEFSALLGEVVALDSHFPGANDPKKPLGVHPIVGAQGLPGRYYAEYRRILLAYAGEQNLERMTYFALRANNPSNLYVGVGWLFAGADFFQGVSHEVLVATTTDKEQHFGNNVTTTTPAEVESYLGDFIPGTGASNSLLHIVEDSTAAETAPMADIEAAVETALMAENPLLSTLDSVDCATCHVATGARRWAERHRGVDASKSPNAYRNSAFDLRLMSEVAEKTNALRGLGYYQSAVALTQRTVNDAAAGATFVNEHFLGGRSKVIGSDEGTGAAFEPPSPLYTELPAMTVPDGTAPMGALAVEPVTGALYVAAGSQVLRGDARSGEGATLSVQVDLASQGVSRIEAMALGSNGTLLAGSGSDVILISATTGSIIQRTTLPIASGPFGGASIAVSPDGGTAFAVEGGPGSLNPDGKSVVRVFRVPLDGNVAPVDSWELAEPFEVVPIEVGAIDATALLVSPDGKALYVAHGVLRKVFEVDVAPPHGVRVLDLDSFQRSALAMSLAPDGIFVQAATFDQTVPVFDLAGVKGATLLAEIPVGLSPLGVASFGRRVFVSMGSGFGFGPPLPGPTAPAPRVRVFQLSSPTRP